MDSVLIQILREGVEEKREFPYFAGEKGILQSRFTKGMRVILEAGCVP